VPQGLIPSHPLFERWKSLTDRLEAALARAGRPPGSAEAMAVVKYAASPDVAALKASGLCRWFAENRVQDAHRRRAELGETSRTGWRFIGHLQGNKAKAALELFDSVDGLDSAGLAEALQRRLEGSGRTLDVLVQVKLTGRETQSGVGLEEAGALVARVKSLPNLRAAGLMGIAPQEGDPRPAFRDLKRIFDALFPGPATRETGPWLSMGMSGDFEAAAEEGATLVRIGSALFK
jgi:pyridoxal phosphate enzyme (YggS family)